MDLTRYRRLFPNLRLSWTAFHLWETNKWDQLKDYLLEKEEFKTQAMVRGTEMHEFADKSDYLPLPPGVQPPTKTISEFKIELPRAGGTIVSVLDKLLFYEETPTVIIDYKSGKLYPYYQRQMKFYLTTTSLHYGIPINRAYLIPIQWENEYKDALLSGEPQMVYFTGHNKFVAEIDKAIYDILFKIDEGWLDE